jgi:glucose/mannose transport system substrate-binding protein
MVSLSFAGPSPRGRSLGGTAWCARCLAVALALCLGALPPAWANGGPRAEVIHWWTARGESAALRILVESYTASGGVWIDSAVVGGEVARAIAVNRIVGGNPPTMAQFNTSTQFAHVISLDLLNNVDVVARREKWDAVLPEPIRSVIKVKGHYYAVPLNVHLPTWFWYSKAAFRKAGITREPANVEEFFAALDKLKAARIIPLAHGGQPWQENLLFLALLGNMGGTKLYLSVFRDRNAAVIMSDEVKQVLLAFKRLRGYVDENAPGRRWDQATELLIQGRAGFQIMGDWVRGEFSLAGLQPGRDYGCMVGLRPDAPVMVQGDAFVFPKGNKPDTLVAQRLLVNLMVNPDFQRRFNKAKGALPIRTDASTEGMDVCMRKGMAALRDRARQVGLSEIYLSTARYERLLDVLNQYWNQPVPVEKAQKAIVVALDAD